MEIAHLEYPQERGRRPHILGKIFWYAATSCMMAIGGLAPTSTFADDDLISNQLRAYLAQYAGQLSGVLLVAKGDQILLQEAYGKASIAYDRNNQVDTKFDLASVGKMFTGVAIVQLAERGLISYTDPIVKYLPNYPNASVASSVTIGELLTHTSGMVDLFNSQFYAAAKNLFVNPTDYFQVFANDPLLFSPGTQFSYSTAGFIVLGAIIESVTGQSYFDYIQKNIFDVAGMPNTGFWTMDLELPNRATPISVLTPPTAGPPQPAPAHNGIYYNLYKGSPGGGSYSTAQDLLAFSLALSQFKLLNQQDTTLLWAPRVAETPPEPLFGEYAYGFEVTEVNGHKIVGHTGGAPGIVNVVNIFTDLGYTAVLLTNNDGDFDKVGTVNARIRDIITR